MLIYSYILYGWAESTYGGRGDGSNSKRLAFIKYLQTFVNRHPDEIKVKVVDMIMMQRDL